MIVNREFRAERLVGSGGMPSCHSATVCALATSAGVVCGTDSPIFGVAVMMAIVVMYDAMGVRRETGRQAVAINHLFERLKEMGSGFSTMFSQERLKEFVGHSPIQVLVGAILGIGVALFECLVLWK